MNFLKIFLTLALILSISIQNIYSSHSIDSKLKRDFKTLNEHYNKEAIEELKKDNPLSYLEKIRGTKLSKDIHIIIDDILESLEKKKYEKFEEIIKFLAQGASENALFKRIVLGVFIAPNLYGESDIDEKAMIIFINNAGNIEHLLDKLRTIMSQDPKLKSNIKILEKLIEIKKSRS